MVESKQPIKCPMKKIKVEELTAEERQKLQHKDNKEKVNYDNKD